MGSASPGVPLGRQAAWSGGNCAGRFPPAFHPGAEQAAGDVPELQAPGKTGSLLRGAGSGQERPSLIFQRKYHSATFLPSAPHRLPAPASRCASFPEAPRIGRGKKQKLSLGRQPLAGPEGAQGTILPCSWRPRGPMRRPGAASPALASRNPRCPAGKPLWANRVLPGAASG